MPDRVAQHGPSGTSASILRNALLQPTSAVSRLTHGGAGNFDIDMPLTGTAGVECRNGGGNYTLVVTFSNTMVSGNASVTGWCRQRCRKSDLQRTYDDD